MWDTVLQVLIDHAPELIGLGLAAIVAWIKSKQWIDDRFLNEFETDVKSAVNDTYQVWVRARKEAAKDGKLTAEEKKVAQQLALNKLKEIGMLKGKNYAKEHLIPLALDLVEKWVTKKKKGEE